MKKEKYQGWTNAQTWCVALWWNNSKKTQDEALTIVRDNLGDNEGIERNLLRFVLRNVSDVWAMASWCWIDCQSVTFDVDWKQLRESLELQIAEERRIANV